jgi:hypothetical protein
MERFNRITELAGKTEPDTFSNQNLVVMFGTFLAGFVVAGMVK